VYGFFAWKAKADAVSQWVYYFDAQPDNIYVRLAEDAADGMVPPVSPLVELPCCSGSTGSIQTGWALCDDSNPLEFEKEFVDPGHAPESLDGIPGRGRMGTNRRSCRKRGG
jgi:hypothetical protein